MSDPSVPPEVRCGLRRVLRQHQVLVRISPPDPRILVPARLTPRRVRTEGTRLARASWPRADLPFEEHTDPVLFPPS
jgi:hypothetical protein